MQMVNKSKEELIIMLKAAWCSEERLKDKFFNYFFVGFISGLLCGLIAMILRGN